MHFALYHVDCFKYFSFLYSISNFKKLINATFILKIEWQDRVYHLKEAFCFDHRITFSDKYYLY